MRSGVSTSVDIRLSDVPLTRGDGNKYQLYEVKSSNYLSVNNRQHLPQEGLARLPHIVGGDGDSSVKSNPFEA